MPLSIEVLKKYKKNIGVFVETGTFMGKGVETALEAGFVEVRSVEVSEKLYRANVARLGGNHAVKLFFGPSEQRLEEMIRDIRSRIVFWLDAHFSDDNTGMSEQLCPLLDELDIIARHPVKNHTILIDDVRLFGTHLPGISLDKVKERVLAINPDYEFSFEDGIEKNDVLVCTTKVPGEQSAPPAQLSVIMSVHNGEKYLHDAVRSVLAQTFYDFELIVVNDASSDSSESILRSFNDPRVRIINNPQRLGLTKSLNIAAAACRGEFIARMDADDISLPHRFQKQVNFLHDNPGCAMVGSSFYVIDAAGTIVSLVPVPSDPDQIASGLVEQNWFCHGSVMIRRTVFEEAGGYDERFACAQDYDLWLRLSEKHRLANMEEPLYCWRKTAQCISEQKGVMQRQYSEMARNLAFERRGGREVAKSTRPSVEVLASAVAVSVVLPTYNRPAWLYLAVESVYAQSFRNFEIIVVNDGGVPVEPVLQSLDKERRIVYVRHAVNANLAAARNTALRLARGEFIAYLDDDDRFYPDHLQTLVEYLQGNDSDVAYSDSYMARQEKRHGSWEVVERKLVYSFDFDYDRILVTNFIPVLCIMHRRSCLDKTGFFDEKLGVHEDWDMWIRMSRLYTFNHIRKVTCEFTSREGDAGQMTGSRRRDFYDTTAAIYEKYAYLVVNRADVKSQQEQTLRQRAVAFGIGGPPGAPSIREFTENVVAMVEKGDKEGAVAYYRLHRSLYGNAEGILARFDELMNKITPL